MTQDAEISEKAYGRETYGTLVDPKPSLIGDTGHPFRTTRTESWISHPSFSLSSPYDGWEYLGPIVPNKGPYTNVPSERWHRTPQAIDLEALGREAIQKTIPTSPHANLATLLGELREGAPSIPLSSIIRGQGRAANNIGSEYLNVEFGWKPMIKDIEKLANAVLDSSQILAQYRRDSGKQVRRRRSNPGIEILNEFTELENQPCYVSGHRPDSYRAVYFDPGPQGQPPGYGTYSLTDKTEHFVWFSGAYSYFLEDGNAIWDRMSRYEQLANKLLGSRITAEVIWELTPWSWLTDWFADMGILISNASALSDDGLVLKYGYLMCKSIRTVDISVTGLALKRGRIGPVSASFRTIRKERIRSTPYGFGSNPDDFTLRQWAILAALGLTKAPRSLR